jgi:DNA primase
VLAERPAVTPERCTAILTWFARAGWIKPETSDDHPALVYLQKRGISPALLRANGIGFVGDYRGAQAALLKHFPLHDLQAAGLFNQNGNLRLYRHRLIIPFLFDRSVYGIQARNIDWRSKAEDGAKEILIGSPRIPFNTDILTNEIKQVFLTEGAIDCLSLLEIGLSAVGIPGALGFKREWTALFDDVPEVVIAFDRDEAGSTGTRRVVEAFEAAGRTGIKAIQWPAGVKDANEFIATSFTNPTGDTT